MSEIKMNFPMTERISVCWRHLVENKVKQDEPSTSHIHPYYEMYIYISGNLSFMVENRIFDLTPGDVIFTKPNQYHHCIYHGDCIHEHYCIDIFTSDRTMSTFFDSLSEKAHLSYRDEDKKELLRLCGLMDGGDSLDGFMQMSTLYNIFSVLMSKADGLANRTSCVSDSLDRILEYIKINFVSIGSSKEIADTFYISQNTLERLFKNELNMSPYQYLLSVRMSNACKCLCDGKTVLEASSESGFGDYSHFISRFKNNFGITPAEYRNLARGDNPEQISKKSKI